MIEAVLAPVLLFLPGYFLFDLLWMRGRFAASAVERLVVGSIVWSTLFVVGGYLVSILSAYALGYFTVFAGVSAGLLAYGAYSKLRRGPRFQRPGTELGALAVVILTLGFLLFSLTVGHQLFLEFDALFYYLPLAKSILITGGLQSDVLHQSVVPTTIEPGLPLMYAFAGFVTDSGTRFDSATRLIPFVYVILTAGAVYLTAKEFLRSKTGAATAAAVFLALPITSSISSNFSLYLDIPFVFYMASAMLAMVKICVSKGGRTGWWAFLGVALGGGLLERDILLFFVPAVVAVAGVLLLGRRQGGPSVAVAALLSAVFAGAYNFFFVYDLRAAELSVSSIFSREAPVVVVMGLFFLLALAGHGGIRRPSMRLAAVGAVPLLPVVVLLGRNYFVSGVLTSNLILRNPQLQLALQFVAGAGRPSVPASSVSQLFGWGTLLSSLQLAGVFVIPAVVGLLAMASKLLRSGESEEKAIIVVVIAYFLAVLLLWSWVFGSAFEGPDLRRLYYFAPLVALFAAEGLSFIASKLKLGPWELRSAVLIGGGSALFWYTQVGASWSINGAASALDRLGAMTIPGFVLFSCVLIVAFLPHVWRVDRRGGRPDNSFSKGLKLLAVIGIVASVGFLAYNSAVAVYDDPPTTAAPPGGWENGLYPVIQYLNQYQYNDYGILTTYALPLAYFTPHPVIDSSTYYGVARLLALNGTSGNWTQRLLGAGIRYMLLPAPGNNFYNYSSRIGENFTLFNQAYVATSPDVVVLKSFPKYTLFEVTGGGNISERYSYLTTFSNGWSPMDPTSTVSHFGAGVVVTGGSVVNESLVAGSQTSYWTPAKAVPSDQITVSDDQAVAIPGTTSLKISLDGTGNMVVYHRYPSQQDLSRYAVLSLYFYGANTSKSVTLTFHTNEWTDYYAYAFHDNFVGWKQIVVPLDSFAVYGSPSWSGINYVEFLMGDRVATYRIDGVTFGGHLLGLVGSTPPIHLPGSSDQVVVSIDSSGLGGGFKPYLSIASGNGTFFNALQNGVNTVEVPANLLSNGAIVEVYVPSLDSQDVFAVLYLGILPVPSS